MSHRRRNKRVVLIAGAAAVVLGGAAVLLPSANASPDDDADIKVLTHQEAAKLGTSLASTLGDDSAGWYYDADAKQLVMNVLSKGAASKAQAEGAAVRTVPNSMADMKAATKTLADKAPLAGTAWSYDPKTNKVVVLADATVTGDKWDTLTGVTGQMSDTVAVQQTEGEFKLFDHGEDSPSALTDDDSEEAEDAEDENDAGDDVVGAPGGDAIFGDGARCSLGFNVNVNGLKSFLTAGHCGNISDTWTADADGQEQLGTLVLSEFPGSDFALVQYDDQNADAPSTVDLQNGTSQDITDFVDASVGLPLQKSGSTTGISEGFVTGLNATVNFENEVVNGLIQTNVCAEPGDSGGPAFSGEAGVGLVSGGAGDCGDNLQDAVTFFQPVTTALEEIGGGAGIGLQSAGNTLED